MIMKPFVFLIIMWRAYITESCTIGDVTSKSCPAGWENLIVRCCESPRSGCACVDIVCTCALVWESYTRTCQDPTCPTDYTDIGVACVCDPVSTLTTLTNQINDARNILSNCAPTLLQVISNFVEPDASDIPAFLAYAHDSMIAFDDCIGTHITRRRMLFNNEYVMALEIGLGVSQIVSEFGAVLGYILIAPNHADRGRFYISEYSGITFDVGMKAFVSLQFYTSLGNIEGTGNYGSFSGSSDIQFGYTLVPPEFTSAGMSWSVSVGGIPSIEYTASIGTTSFNRWLANDEVSQALAQGDNFQWSSAGAIGGQICVQWHEGSDPHTWHDNYLCSKKDHGIAWSSAGSINGMRCTQIHEAADTEGTWHDNFLCVPPNSNLIFQWSSAGSMPAPAKCVQIHEGAEPGHTTWHDNYLCYYWTGNVGEEASGKSLNINCDDDSASHISILTATYGGNCGASTDNQRSNLQQACNGGRYCNYGVDHNIIGDPAGGCAKNYAYGYVCNAAGFSSPQLPELPELPELPAAELPENNFDVFKINKTLMFVVIGVLILLFISNIVMYVGKRNTQYAPVKVLNSEDEHLNV